jgi:hypothetical protein
VPVPSPAGIDTLEAVLGGGAAMVPRSTYSTTEPKHDLDRPHRPRLPALTSPCPSSAACGNDHERPERHTSGMVSRSLRFSGRRKIPCAARIAATIASRTVAYVPLRTQILGSRQHSRAIIATTHADVARWAPADGATGPTGARIFESSLSISDRRHVGTTSRTHIPVPRVWVRLPQMAAKETPQTTHHSRLLGSDDYTGSCSSRLPRED